MRRRSRSRLLMAFVAPAALGWYGCASDSGPVPAALFRPTSAPVPQWVLEAESQIPAGVHALAAPTLSAAEHLIDVLPGALTSTGEQIYRATIVDAAKGHTRKVVLLSSGAAVAPDSLVKAEEAAYRLAHGSLASGLHSEILKSPGSKFAVQIIYRGFAYPSTLGGTPWQTAASLAAYKSKLQTALQAVGGKLSADIQAQGGAVLSAAAFAPMINARLPGTAILAHFMNHPHVAWINKAKEKQVTTFAAQSTQELNLSPVFYAQGYFGETVYGRVGVTGEDFPGGCRIYFEHPAFVFSSASIQYPYSVPQCTSDAECQAACYSGGAVCYNGSCTDEHGTLVTGMLGHRVGADSREAPQASVYMTNGVTFHEPDLDWLYQNDVLTVNESWSGLKKDIFAQDHYTNLGMVFTQASGQGDYPSGADMEAECRAGSVVCVAAYRTLRALYDKSFTKSGTAPVSLMLSASRTWFLTTGCCPTGTFTGPVRTGKRLHRSTFRPPRGSAR